MLTPISSHKHLCLFTKEECKPCSKTKEFLEMVLRDDPTLDPFISVMRSEVHQSLVSEYDIDLYPTLLVVDSDGIELDRIIGGRAVRDQLHFQLLAIKHQR